MPAKSKNKTSSTRPPIVTIMGHVDHGKTSLLDVIRTSHVAQSEEGGITQHTGAYQTFYKDQPITFIDTPGHAAFAKMRARGAQVTDIVILVVAANDGVKPQTVESIKHIKAAKVPLIVAINKMDLPGASVDMVKAQLAEYEIFCEGYGGQVPAVPLSAKTKQGIDQLLEMIILVAQLEDVTGDPEGPLEAVIIESNLDKNRGPIATAIVKNGTLKVHQTIYLDQTPTKIRQLVDEHNHSLTEAPPSKPVVIIGFNSVPAVGMVVTDIPQEPNLTPPVSTEPVKESQQPEDPNAETAAAPDETEPEPPKPSFNLILKADTAGTLEAILQSIMHEEITLINQGIGPINESDVLLAQTTHSLIIGFRVPVTSSAKKIAGIEKVKILSFTIIYELIEFLEEKILEILEPTIHESELGTAKILQVFEMHKVRIAGCLVESGKFHHHDKVRLVRRDRILDQCNITSLKQGKTDVKEVPAGEECGIVLNTEFDFRIGDMIKSYRIIKK